jgi:hypothetical protein
MLLAATLRAVLSSRRFAGRVKVVSGDLIGQSRGEPGVLCGVAVDGFTVSIHYECWH